MEVKVYEEEGRKDALTTFLETLNDKNDIKKVRKLIRFLETQGRQHGMPVSKSLGEGLYELRDRSSGIRLYYMFHGRQIAVLLLGGDKSTQDSDIPEARIRRTKLIAVSKDT